MIHSIRFGTRDLVYPDTSFQGTCCIHLVSEEEKENGRMGGQKTMGYCNYVECLLLISVSLNRVEKAMTRQMHEEMRNLSHISVGNSLLSHQQKISILFGIAVSFCPST